MKMSDQFNINRFGLLVRQDLIHNFKLYVLSLVGFCGGLFILLFLMKMVDGFSAWTVNAFFELFLTVFIATGIMFSGSAFPGLRTREKSYSYLLNPASVLEKFLLEFTGRIVVFIILVPLLYWIIFNAEGYLLQLLNDKFIFKPYFFTDVPMRPPNNWVIGSAISFGFMILMIPFTGAAIFMRYPLPKTLFSIAVIFFFNMFLVYFFLEILGVKSYSHTNTVLWMTSAEDVFKFLTIYATIGDLVLIAAAYLKLKERGA
jgi:hypothetical protein